MNVSNISLEDAGAFSTMFLDYVRAHENLTSFYDTPPRIELFDQKIKSRNFPKTNREVLHKALSRQYQGLKTSEICQENINALSHENTFTVTTGHQLNLCTGPLYFHYKIITTINLARQLAKTYPSYHFVPVYWMATEDHDFDEINHFTLFGETHQWQAEAKGAVGRMSTKSLEELLGKLPVGSDIFKDAYSNQNTLAGAVRAYVNALYGHKGLVVVDADDHDLKSEFACIIEQDIVGQKANDLVEQTNDQLNAKGYKSQAFSRKINFFYLDEDRNRIVENENGFAVNSTSKTFTPDQLKEEIKNHPERFSPNVIMRPVYQEVILPNLAYIGGPAEIIYWLQLKAVFDHYQVPFPVLMPRNFALVVNKASVKKMDKLELSASDVFKSTQELLANFLERHANNEHVLSDKYGELSNLYEGVEQKAVGIDPSLKGFVAAEHAKAKKSFEAIEKRLKKALEQKNETSVRQIETLKEKLFPNGGLQERHDNFLNFWLNDPSFLDKLEEIFDPFEFSFYVLKEE